MTTIVGRKNDDYALIVFFACVFAAACVSTALHGSTGLAIVCGVITLAMVGGAVARHRLPPRELHVSPQRIELATAKRVVGTIDAAPAGPGGTLPPPGTRGVVSIHKRIWRGRARWWMADPRLQEPKWMTLDTFDPEALRDACILNGWQVDYRDT